MAIGGSSPDSSSKSGDSTPSTTIQETPITSSTTTQETPLEEIIERLRPLTVDENPPPSAAATIAPPEKSEKRRFSFIRKSSSRNRLSSGGSSIISAAAMAASTAPSASASAGPSTLAAGTSAAPNALPVPPNRAQVRNQLNAAQKNLQKDAKKIEEELQKLQPKTSGIIRTGISPLTASSQTPSLEEIFPYLCAVIFPENRDTPKCSYKIDHIVIGLSEMFRIEDLLDHFYKFFPRFSLPEQLHTLHLLLDIIVQDRFNEYNSLDLSKKLKLFFLQPNFVSLLPLFEKIIAAKSQIYLMQKTLSSFNLLVDAKSLRSIDELFPQKLIEGKGLKRKAKDIAHELSALSLEFYRKVLPPEFRNNAWKINETKTLTSATLLQQCALSNKISCFFANKILSTKTQEQRICVVKLIILILKNLTTEKKLVDFNSGMAVLASLNYNPVNRLNLPADLDKKYQAILQEVKELFSETKNYPVLRPLSLSPHCIPFLGLTFRDLTFAEDGNAKNLLRKWETKGHTYMDLFSHIDRLREVDDIIPQTNLIKSLEDTPDFDACEDAFSELSYQIKPKTTPPAMHEETSPPTLTPSYAAATAAAVAAAAIVENPLLPASSAPLNGSKTRTPARKNGSYHN